MEIEEILNSAAFWILVAVGYSAFVFMLIILKKMGNAEIMPWWVKIAVMIVVPVVAALFSGFAEG